LIYCVELAINSKNFFVLQDTPTVLTSIAVIKSLSALELGHYCYRYDVGEGGSTPDDLAERQDAVQVAIGCTSKIS
jgi:hypothetical protein